MFRLTIIGAGRGGEALIRVLQDDINIEIVAISDSRQDAPALKLAQSLAIPIFHHIEELPSCDMAINVTGSKTVSKQLRHYFAADVEIMEGKAAHFFYDQVSNVKMKKSRLSECSPSLKNLIVSVMN